MQNVSSTIPRIFDSARRRLRRDRAASNFAEHDFLIDHIGQCLLARLDMITRPLATALDLGCHDGRLGQALAARGLAVTSVDAGARFAAMAGGLQREEDKLDLEPGQFDLVISAGVLDQVNDLPGALIQIRRALKPDGLLLAGFFGAGSLPLLRSATLAADLARDGAVGTRIHPQIDVRAAGDLLARAGFALPVADGEGIDIRYSDPWRLIRDLRGMAATNMMAGTSAPVFDRARLDALLEALAARADADGRVTERFEIVYLTAWSPAPDQPRPARRGSAVQSLAQALKPKGS